MILRGLLGTAWEKRRLLTMTWLNRHRRSIMWLGLAAISFLFAALFTWHIAHEADPFRDPSWEGKGVVEFAVLAAEGSRGRAELVVSYGSGNAQTLFSFFLPEEAERLIIFGDRTPFECYRYGTNETIPRNTTGKGAPYLDLANLHRNKNEPLQCLVKAHEFRETFTRTVLAFFVHDLEEDELRTMPVDLTIDRSQGPFEFIGPYMGHWGISEGRIHMDPPYHILYVRFTSLRNEQGRDWYLVLIGAFVALGASLVVEAVRPFIDKITERREAA
jgi:hypothetical protein